jgi:hypothetical protein
LRKASRPSEQRRRSRAASIGEEPVLVYWYAPRYTDDAGPARAVTEEQALSLARQEARRYYLASLGKLGEDLRSKASLGGLAGIVEMRVVAKDGWEILDLIVGARFFRATVAFVGRRP